MEQTPGQEVPITSDPQLPSLLERVLLVLLFPGRAFTQHHAGWGFLGPWLLVSALGLLAGVMLVSLGDVESATKVAIERELEKKFPSGPPDAETKEALDTSLKLGVFVAKVACVAGPAVGGLLGFLWAGALIFTFSLLLGPVKLELSRCLSLAAYLSLVNGLGYLAQSVALLLGSPQPATSLLHLVDLHQAPVAAAALGRLDPTLIYYYVLLGAVLGGACRVSRQRAFALAGVGYLFTSLLGVGWTAVVS